MNRFPIGNGIGNGSSKLTSLRENSLLDFNPRPDLRTNGSISNWQFIRGLSYFGRKQGLITNFPIFIGYQYIFVFAWPLLGHFYKDLEYWTKYEIYW